MQFYCSIFQNSGIKKIQYYPEGITEGPMKGFDGQVLTGVFELEGQQFMCLDGGSTFKFNPGVSFFVNCKTPEGTKAFFEKLVESGQALMPLQKYPFSEMYGWLQDKYGLNWQINVSKAPQKIVPAFMFIKNQFGRCEEAINFYTSIFKNSKVNMLSRYEENEGDEVGKIKYASFSLEDQQFIAMESSGDHKWETSGAVSQLIECKDQAEIDYYWDKLTEGGDPKSQQCGWLMDKFGFSWQVVPDMTRWLNSKDKEANARAMQAMLKMKKIDIAKLEEAYGKH